MKQFYRFLIAIGFDPLAFYHFLKGIPSFTRGYFKFKKALIDKTEFPFGTFYPLMKDKHSYSGIMKGGYFHHDLLVARDIYYKNPDKHVDIGSRIDGFVAHVAVFRKIEVFDIRKQVSSHSNIIFKQANFMDWMGVYTEYCDSISSLNAIEHFGLGRYGDPINPYGHIKAIENIHLMLKPKGIFYFAVPMGRQRIEFNAHRVFNLSYLLMILDSMFYVKSFSYVDDNGNLHENIELTSKKVLKNYECNLGYAIFTLIKL